MCKLHYDKYGVRASCGPRPRAKAEGSGPARGRRRSTSASPTRSRPMSPKAGSSRGAPADAARSRRRARDDRRDRHAQLRRGTAPRTRRRRRSGAARSSATRSTRRRTRPSSISTDQLAGAAALRRASSPRPPRASSIATVSTRSLHYQPHAGHLRHREAGAAWVGTRGVAARPDEIVVTAGAQHAMLVALATLTRPRDIVLVEALTYPGLDLARQSSAAAARARRARRRRSVGPRRSTRPPRAPKARVALHDADAAQSHGLTMSASAPARDDRDRGPARADAHRGRSVRLPLRRAAARRARRRISAATSPACRRAWSPGSRVGFLRASGRARAAPGRGAVFASAVMAPPVGAELAARWIADGTRRPHRRLEADGVRGARRHRAPDARLPRRARPRRTSGCRSPRGLSATGCRRAGAPARRPRQRQPGLRRRTRAAGRRACASASVRPPRARRSTLRSARSPTCCASRHSRIGGWCSPKAQGIFADLAPKRLVPCTIDQDQYALRVHPRGHRPDAARAPQPRRGATFRAACTPSASSSIRAGRSRTASAGRWSSAAEREGRIRPGDTLIEPTSGNTGIGIALAGAVRGYRVIITMPEKMSREKQVVLEALGAEIIRTPTEAAFDSPESHISVARRLQSRAAQRAHPRPVLATRTTRWCTSRRPRRRSSTISTGSVDMVVMGAGTGGSITGVARRLKAVQPVVPHRRRRSRGVDPRRRHRGRHLQGRGDRLRLRPGGARPGVVDEWVKTSDQPSFLLARRLIREEGLLVGGSSGSAMYAALQAAPRLTARSDLRGRAARRRPQLHDQVRRRQVDARQRLLPGQTHRGPGRGRGAAPSCAGRSSSSPRTPTRCARSSSGCASAASRSCR